MFTLRIGSIAALRAAIEYFGVPDFIGNIPVTDAIHAEREIRYQVELGQCRIAQWYCQPQPPKPPERPPRGRSRLYGYILCYI